MNGGGGRWRFERFELDAEAETLRRDGRSVKLQPQPLRVLAILIEHAGQVVPREELQRRVWDQATFVEFDQGLNYCIRQIRAALRDDPEKPKFIETLRRKGYRFIAAVESIVEVDAPPAEPGPMPMPMPVAAARRVSGLALAAAVLVLLAGVVAARAFLSRPPSALVYTQTTNFTQPAFAPALSPDGRIVAFLVGSDASFPPTGEVYTRMLPDGEPIQRTHDGWPKYGLSFSPDGAQITYTVADATRGWVTESLDVGGGEPRLLVPNAAGLTWVDPQHVLFGEIKKGLHMGLVAATIGRDHVRDVYLPAHERAMAHQGAVSPDKSSVLIVEMGPTGGWERCRLVPFDGRSAGQQVGPDGPCTAAAWSPDGAWMYFTARVNGSNHLWRQRAPAGPLEQLTSGPGEEDGVALSADGRSLVTSVGMIESGVWMHTPAGDRLISPEGYAWGLSFSSDGTLLYYVLRRTATSMPEVWVTDLRSGTSEPVVQGHTVESFDVSADGMQIVFAARSPEGASQLWLASRDGRSVPRLVGTGDDQPFFGRDGDIVFRASENARNYLFRMKLDGSARAKVLAGPIVELKGVSPDRRVAVAMVPVDEVPSTAVMAIRLDDGAATRLCPAECMARWSPDGRHLYVEPLLQGHDGGQTAVIPVPAGTSLPTLPPGGVRLAADEAAVRGSRIIDLSTYDPAHAGTVAPGASPDTFAFTKTVSHRNLFQVRLQQ